MLTNNNPVFDLSSIECDELNRTGSSGEGRGCSRANRHHVPSHLLPAPHKEKGGFPSVLVRRSFKASGPAWGQKQRPVWGQEQRSHGPQYSLYPDKGSLRKNFLFWIYKHILKDYMAHGHYFNDKS